MSLASLLLLISHFNLQHSERSEVQTLHKMTMNTKTFVIRASGWLNGKTNGAPPVTETNSNLVSEYQQSKSLFLKMSCMPHFKFLNVMMP